MTWYSLGYCQPTILDIGQSHKVAGFGSKCQSHKCHQQGSPCHPSTEFLHPVRMSCHSQEVRVPPAEEDRPSLDSPPLWSRPDQSWHLCWRVSLPELHQTDSQQISISYHIHRLFIFWQKSNYWIERIWLWWFIGKVVISWRKNILDTLAKICFFCLIKWFIQSIKQWKDNRYPVHLSSQLSVSHGSWISYRL